MRKGTAAVASALHLFIKSRRPFFLQPLGKEVCDDVQVHPNVTMAVSTALHFFIDMVVAFLFTIFMTELTKVATGVLRCARSFCSSGYAARQMRQCGFMLEHTKVAAGVLRCSVPLLSGCTTARFLLPQGPDVEVARVESVTSSFPSVQ